MTYAVSINTAHPRERLIHMQTEARRTGLADHHKCTPQGCVMEPVQHEPAGKHKTPYPPCLVNLFLDPDHPSYFPLTGEHVACPYGKPGSCMDQFKSHVEQTVGTEAFLRALGNVDEEQLTSLMSQALEARGLDTGADFDMCCMAALAGRILISDKVSSLVQDRLCTLDAVATLMVDDEDLQKMTLAQACSINDEGGRCQFFQAMGIAEKPARKLAKLLAPWIPQEVSSPTAQSEEDVHEAISLLKKQLTGVKKTISTLMPDVKYWQLSKGTDILADCGGVVKQVFEDLGVPGPARNVDNLLSKVVDVHVSNVAAQRVIEMEVKFVIGAATGLAALGGLATVATTLAAAAPSMAADGLKFQQTQLLSSLGISTQQDLEKAQLGLVKDFLELCVSMAV